MADEARASDAESDMRMHWHFVTVDGRRVVRLISTSFSKFLSLLPVGSGTLENRLLHLVVRSSHDSVDCTGSRYH